MSFKWQTYGYGQLANFNWLTSETKISFAVRTRFWEEISPATHQSIFAVRGANGYLWVRGNSSGNLQVQVYSNGYYCSVTGPAFNADVTYHISGSWQAGQAAGLQLYIDGTYYGSGSTSTQTGFEPGEATLWLNVLKTDTNYGRQRTEDLVLVSDYLLTAEEAKALYWGVPPRALPLAAKEFGHWALHDCLLTRIPDLSGNGRHFESADLHNLEAGDILAKTREDERLFEAPWGGATPTGASGPPDPNPWVFCSPAITHPNTEKIVSGLTNGTTYEFMVKAVDWAGNVSGESDIVEVTPQSFSRHFPRQVLLFYH